MVSRPVAESDLTALWTIRRDGSELRQITDPSRNPLDSSVHNGPEVATHSPHKSLAGPDVRHDPTWIRQDHAAPRMSALNPQKVDAPSENRCLFQRNHSPMSSRPRTLRTLLSTLCLLVAAASGCGVIDTEPPRDTTDPNPGPFRVDQTPAWSPNGRFIAYHRDALRTDDTTDASGLYVLDLETNATSLLRGGSARSPDWRSDGKRLAFSTGNIYTIQPDGSDLRQVTEFGSSFRPHWSPSAKPSPSVAPARRKRSASGSLTYLTRRSLDSGGWRTRTGSRTESALCTVSVTNSGRLTRPAPTQRN